MPKAKWHLARVEFHLPEGLPRPNIEKAEAPKVADDADMATATLTFDINEKGAPFNLQIEKASNEGWSRDVAAALSKWRFTSASEDGSPVSISCSMDFVRGN